MRENISHWEENIPLERRVVGTAGCWEKQDPAALRGAGPVNVHITPRRYREDFHFLPNKWSPELRLGAGH